MRKLIIPLVLMVGVMFVLTQFAEIEDILNTIERGDWRFLSLAALVEALWIVNIGASFKAIYRVVGMTERLGRLILLSAAANFVNIIAPSGGIGGVAIFISEARSRAYSAGRATVASTLFVLFDYIGFLAILTVGFVVLIRRNRVTTPDIAASIIIVVIALSLAALLYIGARSEQRLAHILVRIAKAINRAARLFRPRRSADYLPMQRAHTFAHDIADGLQEMRRNPKGLLFPALLAINSKVLMIVVLYFVFLAFETPVSIGTLIAGFCIAYLFIIVSPTPAGIGIVEGLLTLTLSSFFIPLGSAAVIALAYRGFTFWLSLLFGLIAFRWVAYEPI
ncbi:MAG: flippase-like domain-containing protein [Chloroflexi bacterium]|nr:flippase-like domain-containing protein [Chloroflexota bacterium]